MKIEKNKYFHNEVKIRTFKYNQGKDNKEFFY